MSACLSPIDDSIEHIVPWERSPGARCSHHQHKPNWNIEYYYCCCSHAPVSAVCSVWLIVWKIHGLELLYFMVMASYHSIILYCYFNCDNKYVHTVVEKSLWYFVLLYYSHKSWSIFKTRDRFGICWSWRFQNTPYMSNLTKFWLRYLRLKTNDWNLLFLW